MTGKNLISKGGNALRIIILILTLSILNLAYSTSLEMRVYNVGQANFIALKHGKNVVIADCGTASNESWDNMRSDLSDFLGSTEKISVLVTHQHKDHYNKLNELFDLINLKENPNKLDKIIVGGNSNELENSIHLTDKNKEKTIKEKIYCYRYEKQNLNVDINTEISNLLGKNVKTQFLLPTIRDDITEEQRNDVHFQNLVLKVSYGGRNLLLTGDANENLISCFSKEQLQDVDALIFPHHGSDASGRAALFEKIQNCCLGIISSDPDGKDSLLRQIHNENVVIEKGSHVKKHNLTIKKEGTISRIKDSKDPIFLTSESDICFNISFSSKGVMKLYNTGKNKLLFKSIEAGANPKCTWKTIEQYLERRYSKKTGVLNSLLKMVNEMDRDESLNPYLEKGDINEFIRQIVMKKFNIDDHAGNVYLKLLNSETPLTKKHFDISDGKSLEKATTTLKKLKLIRPDGKKWSLVEA